MLSALLSYVIAAILVAGAAPKLADSELASAWAGKSIDAPIVDSAMLRLVLYIVGVAELAMAVAIIAWSSVVVMAAAATLFFIFFWVEIILLVKNPQAPCLCFGRSKNASPKVRSALTLAISLMAGAMACSPGSYVDVGGLVVNLYLAVAAIAIATLYINVGRVMNYFFP